MPTGSVGRINVQLGELHPLFVLLCSKVGIDPIEQLRRIALRLADAGNPIPKSEGKQGHRIRIRLGEHHAAFVGACNGQSPSSVLRALVAQDIAEHALGGDRPGIIAPPQAQVSIAAHIQPGQQSSMGARLELRLTQSELHALKSLAALEKTSAQTLLRTIFRAYALKSSALPKETQHGLGQINTALIKIGANLNQIAKHLNSGEPFGQELAQHIEQALSEIGGHVKSSAQQLELCNERWDLKVAV